MFILHEKLEADTAFIVNAPLSSVRLMGDSRYPWLVLVPRLADIVEIHDLSVDDQMQLMAEISVVSRAIKRLYDIDKINVGALGNMVAQLHVHVVGRSRRDPAWPGPVWGALAPVPYTTDQRAVACENIRVALAQDFS